MAISKTQALNSAELAELKIMTAHFLKSLRNSRIVDGKNDRSDAALYREAKSIDTSGDNLLSASEIAALLKDDPRARAVAKTISPLDSGLGFEDAVANTKADEALLKLKDGDVIITRTSFQDDKAGKNNTTICGQYWAHPGECTPPRDGY